MDATLRTSRQSISPVVSSLLSAGALLALVAYRWAAWGGLTSVPLPSGLVLGGYVLWLVLEARVATRELDKGTTRLDRWTLELYAAGRTLTVTSALVLHDPRTASAPLAWAGCAIFALGVGLRFASIRELGNFYSHRVRVLPGHTVVESGPYRFLRHPSYAGMLLAHVGFVLCFFHWVSLLALAFVFVPAVIRRIRVEERALLDSVAGYADYCRGRLRLIPFVW